VLVGQGSLPVQLQQQLMPHPHPVLAAQGSLPVQLQPQGSAAGLQVGVQQQPPAYASLQDGLVDFDIERDIPGV
jgi:hypothetical protein